MKMQCPPTGRFQPAAPDGFAESNDTQTGTEALFGMRPIFQNCFDQFPAVRPDGLGPFHDAAGSPLQIFLMRFGPMLFDRGEAA